MSDFGELSDAELARQLRDPEGDAGLAVIDRLEALNADGSKAVMGLLEIGDGMEVLEQGCGLGTLADAIVGLGRDVRYCGLDRSDTMIATARERNAALIAGGVAEFFAGTSESLPFADASFDRLFSLGLLHFWPEPAAALAEARRAMRAGGRMVMAGLGTERPPAFATEENGFFLRPAARWEALMLAAGFATASAMPLDLPDRPQGLMLVAVA